MDWTQWIINTKQEEVMKLGKGLSRELEEFVGKGLGVSIIKMHCLQRQNSKRINKNKFKNKLFFLIF